MLKAVIMAGGAGTRFWPVSRQATPKHLLTVVSERPLVAETVARAQARLTPADIFIYTTPAQVEGIAQAVPQLPRRNIVAEPVGRDTAACIGYAATRLLRDDADCMMLVMPADHLIRPVEEFWRTVDAGMPLAERPGNLVTFGIRPTWPSPGYGYIHRGEEVARHDDIPVYRLRQFQEKPDVATAEKYLAGGEYFWNSGIFLWRAGSILEAISKHMPAHGRLLKTIDEVLGTGRELEVLDQTYPRFERISIDFGVMEKAENVFVVGTSYDWDDVGSWLSLVRHRGSDKNANTVIGDHVSIDSANCIVVAGDGHTVATLGVDDLIIVHTPDATLVAQRDRAGEVKKLVEELKKRRRDELL